MAPAVVTSIQPAPWPPTSPRGCRWFFLAPPRAGGTHRLGGGALSWSGVTVGSAASCQTLDRLAVAVGVDLDEEQRQPLSMGVPDELGSAALCAFRSARRLLGSSANDPCAAARDRPVQVRSIAARASNRRVEPQTLGPGQGNAMKHIVVVLVAGSALLFAGAAAAQSSQQNRMAVCNALAGERSLNGDARTSFLTKCVNG